MSGGVGHCKDIGILTEHEAKALHDTSSLRKRRRLLSFRLLNVLAVIVILSASGMVALEDLAFLIISFLYILFLARLIFPPLRNDDGDLPILAGSPSLTAYTSMGSAVGLLLPIAYICHGIVEGDKGGIKAATPHTLLLAGQVFMEGVAGAAGMSVPVRAFVPVLCTAKRLPVISEWLRSEMVKEEEEQYGTERRLRIGRGLALANLVFWSIHLFCFLIPFYLPRAFRRYYGFKEKPQ